MRAAALLLLLASPAAADPLADLGQALFFDPALSLNGAQSCASCHDPNNGFTAPLTHGSPFAEGALRWPAAGDALFLRAREGAALHARGGLQALACTQPFKPEADRLQRIGVACIDYDALPAAR